MLSFLFFHSFGFAGLSLRLLIVSLTHVLALNETKEIESGQQTIFRWSMCVRRQRGLLTSHRLNSSSSSSLVPRSSSGDDVVDWEEKRKRQEKGQLRGERRRGEGLETNLEGEE
jgi:hypothetical protein